MSPIDSSPDTQIVELIGRHYLTAELLQAGLEVATPVRDRGVDMIAYADIDSRVDRFSSCPIQLKASRKQSFSLDRKYKRFHNLLLVYVWNLSSSDRRVSYALTYEEALAVATQAGWTKTPSWKKGGYYANTRPGAKLLALLEPYRMSPERWHAKVLRIMSYEEREFNKRLGRELYHNGSTPEARARGLMMVIESHFYRNPEAPNLAEYASHWLLASAGEFDREVVDLLVAKYPPPVHPRIQPGYSDWDSFGNPSYPA